MLQRTKSKKVDFIVDKRFIPVNEPWLTDLELEYATDAIKSGFISGLGGNYLKKFEEKLAEFTGKKYAVACSSGMTALHLAVRAAGIKKNDEVITNTFTNISSLLGIVYSGGKPVLVDSRKDTWCIDESAIESKITSRTKAIMPVHIYGHPCEMDKIVDMAKGHDLIIIEDVAEAQGATFKNKMLPIGDIGCFSFLSNKVMTTGEGGAVVTDSEKIAEKVRSLRSLAFGNTPETRYLHTDLGFNYRITNIQCAIGCAQLERIDEIIKKKRQVAAWYNEQLKKVKDIILPVEKEWAKNVYWQYGIVLKKEFEMNRSKFMDALKEKGVDTRAFFVPMHKQPAFHDLGLFKNAKLPVSERLGEYGLYFPSSATLTKEDIVRICNAIKELHG